VVAMVSNVQRDKLARFRQTGTTIKWKDKLYTAKVPGWRTSKTGHKYYENRANRSDLNKKKKL